MDEKIKIIEKVYFDPTGFGSVAETLKDARKYDKSICKNEMLSSRL